MKRNLIIFEGHDMVGKTTIADALSKELDIPVLKVVKKNKWHDTLIDLIYGVEVHVQTAEQTNISVIYDRLFPSEYAYSKAYERPTVEEKIFDYDRRMAALGAKIIICHKKPEAYQEDDQGMIEIEKYEKLFNAYKDYSTKTACDVLFLDTSDEDLTLQIEAIKSFLEN